MMKNTTVIFILTVLAAGATAWFVESCTSNVSAASSSRGNASMVETDSHALAYGDMPVVDKSSDSLLAAITRELLPFYEHHLYADAETGIEMSYSLFEPRQKSESATSVPLIVFMGDATTVGLDVTRPLRQGYGAFVWSTFTARHEHPAYVLVPQFNGVAVSSDGSMTAEVDVVKRLIGSVVSEHAIDSSRIYLTGQGMGATIAMHLLADAGSEIAAAAVVGAHADAALTRSVAGKPLLFVSSTTDSLSMVTARRLPDDMPVISVAAAHADSLDIEQMRSAVIYLDNSSCRDGHLSDISLTMLGYDDAFRMPALRKWLFSK